MVAAKSNYKSRFLTEGEKAAHYAKVSGVNLNVYAHVNSLKVYEGAEFVVYRMNKHQELEIITAVSCTNIAMSNLGLKISLIDRRTFFLAVVGDVPNRLFRMDVITHAPYLTEVERTLKETKRGKIQQGITTELCCRTKAAVGDRYAQSLQMLPMNEMHHHFSREEIDDAYSKLEEEE